MKMGDSKQVTIKPEEGYGRVNDEAFVEAKKEQVPQDALRVDAQLEGRDASGRTFQARVAEIRDETVVLDFNHPLAGKTLFFEVKILDIQETSVE
jgi:FKBP-type peptidyl-prolyl cis-trans isomerase SlyD